MTTTTSPEDLWQEALSQLRLQMTAGTFDAWLNDSQGVQLRNDVLTIQVKNSSAVDWLENRLANVINRTLHRVTGNGTTAQFITADDELPAEERKQAIEEPVQSKMDNVDTDAVAALESVLVRIGDPEARRVIQNKLAEMTGVNLQDNTGEWSPPEFDASKRWFKVHEYASRFWGPYLGPRAFRLWEAIVRRDTRRKKTEWTPALRFSAPKLAQELGYRSKQGIIGVDRRCDAEHPGAFLKSTSDITEDNEAEPQYYYHRPGALDQLVAAGIAEVKRSGTKRHTTYEISVKVTLDWLTPGQLHELDDDLQVQHDAWVTESGLDPDLWH